MILANGEPPMSGKELQKAGEILFGPKWKARLARKLHIGRTTLWRYAQAENVPERAADAVQRLIEEEKRSRK